MAEVTVPRAATRVIGRAVQIHGGGVTDVTPLAAMYVWHRTMRLSDGPDEVHLRSIEKSEWSRTPSSRPAGDDASRPRVGVPHRNTHGRT